MDERDGLLLQRRGNRAELRLCVVSGMTKMKTETKTRRETRRSIVERMGQPSSKKNVRGGRVRDSRLDVEREKKTFLAASRSEKPHVFCVIMEGHDLLSIKSLTSRRGDEERGGSARSSRDDLKQNKPGIRRETPNAFFREKEKKAKRVSFARTYRYTSASSPPRGAPGAPTARVPRRCLRLPRVSNLGSLLCRRGWRARTAARGTL